MTDLQNSQFIGRSGNDNVWRDTEEDLNRNPYQVNNLGVDCCICMESKYRVYKCDKCNDGLVCVSCFKNNTKVKNYVYPTSPSVLDAENLMILTYKCPICRDYRGEDLTEPTRKKYEFTKEEFSDKILNFNQTCINNFSSFRITDEMFESTDRTNRMVEDGLTDDEYSDYRSEEEDEEEDGLYLEDWINDSLLVKLCSIHGLTGEDRVRQAERQSREIDVINNVYTLNLLFNEHFTYDDY